MKSQGYMIEDSAVDQSENILSDNGIPVWSLERHIYPCFCELCWHIIEDSGDEIWHGYGECVDIPAWLWEEM